jgi:hypothetical protein
MTTLKTIVVWDCEDILSPSIEHILGSRKDWNVVTISVHSGYEALRLAIWKLQPDFVIIRQEENKFSSNLPMQLLQDKPTLKVISVGMDSNLIEIFSNQKILIKEASDLISIIDK